MKKYERSNRMQERLEASLAGLEELDLLRRQHMDLVNEAKTLTRRRRSMDAELYQILGQYQEFCTSPDTSFNDTHNEVTPAEPCDPDDPASVSAKVEEWLRASQGAPAPDLDTPDSAPSINASLPAPRLGTRRFSVDLTSQTMNDKRRMSVDLEYLRTLRSSPKLLSNSAKSDNGADKDLKNSHSVDMLSPKDQIDAPSAGTKGNEDHDPTERTNSPLENQLNDISGYSKMSPYRRFSVDVGDLSNVTSTSFLRRRSFAAPDVSNRSQMRRASVSFGALHEHTPFTQPYKLSGSRTVFSFPSPMHAVLLPTKASVTDDSIMEPEGVGNRSVTELAQDHLCEILRKPSGDSLSLPSRLTKRRGSQCLDSLRQISEEDDDVDVDVFTDVKNHDLEKTATSISGSDVTSSDGTSTAVQDDSSNESVHVRTTNVTMTSSRTSITDVTDNDVALEENKKTEHEFRMPKQSLKRYSLRSDTTDSGFTGSCMSLSTQSSYSSYSRRCNPGAWSFSSNDSDSLLCLDYPQGSRLSCTESNLAGDELSDDERRHRPKQIEPIPEGGEVRGVSPAPVRPPRRRPRKLESEPPTTTSNHNSVMKSDNMMIDSRGYSHDEDQPPKPAPRTKLQLHKTSTTTRSMYENTGARPKTIAMDKFSPNAGTLV